MRHSTSPPCGNLVDGLPHDCHTETIAKLARLGPAKNGTTLENFIELTMFCIMFEEKNSGFLIQNILKINIDVLNHIKGNATARSMISRIFWKFGKVQNF